MFLNDGYRFLEAHLDGIWLERIRPLLSENHQETGIYDRPFNPDFERYLSLAVAGFLKFFVAHTDDGKLIGCAIFFMDSEIQQRDVQSATQSVNFVCRSHRGVGYAFMKFCDDILKKQGVNSVWRQASAKHDISKVYERMGYTLIEKSYLRRLCGE